MNERACTICGETKALTEFPNDKRGKFGHRADCRACHRAKNKIRYQRDKEKRLAAQKIYYAANSERIKEYVKGWRQANPDKVKQYHDEYAAANPEKERERHKAKSRKRQIEQPEKLAEADRRWRQANPDKVRAKTARRRAKKVTNGVYKILPRELKRLYASPCAHCGATGNTVADHIIPLVRGGRHSIGNLQPLCFTCNSVKQGRLQIAWLAEMRHI